MSKKPNGYWSKIRVGKEALKYDSPISFRRGSSAAHSVACREGWLEEVCQHMDKIKPWTLGRCIEAAKPYSSRQGFKNAHPGAYNAVLINSWDKKVFRHMKRQLKPCGFWTKERCHKEALKYKTRQKFFKGSISAYSTAHQSGWIDEICQHMSYDQLPKGHWTLERIRKEAKKYQTRSDFAKGSPLAYGAASRKGVVDEVCLHMRRLGNLYRRAIYIFDFADKSVYVGLSQDPVTREKQHLMYTKRLSEKANSTKYQFRILTGMIGKLEAADAEAKFIAKYLKAGWVILNRAKAGALGGNNLVWTKEKCAEAAKKCKMRSEFIREYPGAYASAAKRGWLKEICRGMIRTSKPTGYWTKARVAKAAKKYKTRGEFKDNESPAYGKALTKGWIDYVCRHMIELKHPKGYWTNSRLAREAKKYKTKSEFVRKSKAAYQAANRLKLLPKICGHMKPGKKPNGYWNMKTIAAVAKKYSTRTDFWRGDSAAHNAARRLGILDDVCRHMSLGKR
jgi:predicted GIY-YIG superfamily endonuclease